MDFKPGDKVKCIDIEGGYGIILGHIYTVSEVNGEFIILENPGLAHHKSRFELIRSIKPKYNHKKFNKLLEDI